MAANTRTGRDLCRRLRENSKSLTVVYCSMWRLSNDDVDDLTSALRRNNRIVMLDLSHGSLRYDGAMQRFTETVLSKHTSLKTLLLVSCGLFERQACWIGEALQTNRRLTSLSLHRNHLGDLGTRALALGLVKNKRLQYLSLSDNNIGDDGCVSLASMLRTNRTLLRLDLSGNADITNVGVMALIDVLRTSNYTLQTVRFEQSNDRVSPELVTQLQQLCADNTRLKSSFEQMKRQQTKIPTHLWPKTLAIVNEKPDMVYALLKTNPNSIFY